MSETVRSRRWRRARTVAALAATVLGASACSWFTAFVEQPKVDPWEAVSFPTNTLQPSRGKPAVLGPDQGHVRGGLSGLVRAAARRTVDSMSGLKNPTPRHAASLENGRKIYPDQLQSAATGRRGRATARSASIGLPAPSLAHRRGQGSHGRLHLGR